MHSQDGLKPQVTTAAEAKVLRAFGEQITIHLEGKHTGGTRTMWTEITPPGGGPPPHYHEFEDETFYVEQGAMDFLIDGRWKTVEAGGAVFAPKNSVHTFRNNSNAPARMLVSTSPSGFEVFFSRCQEEFARPGGPDMGRILQISAEHGIHFVAEGVNQPESKPRTGESTNLAHNT